MELKLGDTLIAEIPPDIARRMLAIFRTHGHLHDARIDLRQVPYSTFPEGPQHVTEIPVMVGELDVVLTVRKNLVENNEETRHAILYGLR